MPGDETQLWRLLRSIDDPHCLEFPANYHHRRTRARFDELAQRLDRDFNCGCDVDRHLQDASLHGRIEVPAATTATGRVLVLSISNFGGLAVLSVDNPGTWDEVETHQLLHADDARRIHSALADLGYTLVPEEPLWQRYDGASDLPSCYPDDSPPTWWTRYFDYL